MPVPAYRPEPLRFQMFRGTEALEAGVLTPNQLRSGAWIRLGYDVYADARLERDHELACRAVALRLPPEAAFAGPSAAYLLGVPHAADFTGPVHVVVPAGVRLPSRSGLRVHRVDLEPTDVDTDCGLPRTSPSRTVWDLATWMEPTRSVPIIDALGRSGVVNESSLKTYLATRQARRGYRRATQAVALFDPRAESAPESVLRVRLVLAGMPRPEVQYEIRLPAITLHPDLAWPAYRVAMEYEGRWHGDPNQLPLDRRRLNRLAAAGWTVLHVTNEQLWRGFSEVLAALGTALRSRGWPG